MLSGVLRGRARAGREGANGPGANRRLPEAAGLLDRTHRLLTKYHIHASFISLPFFWVALYLGSLLSRICAIFVLSCVYLRRIWVVSGKVEVGGRGRGRGC